jgi:hypothetical protein
MREFPSGFGIAAAVAFTMPADAGSTDFFEEFVRDDFTKENLI